jgi:FkbM family methyltransferase
MSELLFRLLVAGAATGQSLPHRLLLKLRRLLVRIANPTVRWKLGGRTCEIPLGHDLPIILAMHPQYCGFIVRAAQWLDSRVSDLAVVDVGANIGDTALMLRAHLNCPVLCIEGNANFANLLRRNVAGLDGVETVQTLLGETVSELHGRMLTSGGSSAVAKDAHAEALRTEPLDQVLAAHPHFLRAKLLKIDTDGYDLAILRGATRFIEQTRPVLVFEYDPHHLAQAGEDGLTIFPHLRRLGYGFALVYDNLGDLILGADLDQAGIFAGLHEYFSGRNTASYADLCIFHKEDAALAAGFHMSERTWFANARQFQRAPVARPS